MQPLPEVSGIDFLKFKEEILPAAKPVVFRGLVRDWPVVAAGRQSVDAFCAYLTRFDRGASVTTMFAPPSVKGRFHYNADLTGFNFQSGTAKLASALDFLKQSVDLENPSTLAIQSVPTRGSLPGFEQDNPMPLLDGSVEPRVWIGNAGIVAAHNDPSENIACCAIGRRRFTLFPPDQLRNLYQGPLELTPAGTTISMVDFDAPDFDKYPRFREALDNAFVVDLEPGDALFLPYFWWHHVRALDKFNMLVNYWWAPPSMGRGTPRDAWLHALLSLSQLPKAHRDGWRIMFDHYVFGDDGDPGAHLPADKRGIMGEVDAHYIEKLRLSIAKSMTRSDR